MRYRLLLPSLVTLGALGLVACGETATQPNTPEDRPTVPELAVGTNRWVVRAAMPKPVTGLTVAVLGNGSGKPVVFAIGGSSGEFNTSVVQAYHVSTNTWSFKANYPEPISLTNGAGVINGKIYVSGGALGSFGSQYESNSLYQYDRATNVWTRKHDLPAKSSSGITGVIGGRLYVLTTFQMRDGRGKAFWRYDPGTDTWASLPTAPSDHSGGVGAVIGRKFYVVGGGGIDNDTWVASRKLDVYDPATNRWTTRPGLPGIRTDAASAALDGKLYVIGGWGIDTTSSSPMVPLVTVKVYDTATKLWTTAHVLPQGAGAGWRAAGTVMVNGQARIELLGGFSFPNNLQYIP